MTTIFEQLALNNEMDKWDIQDAVSTFIEEFIDNDNDYLKFDKVNNPLSSDSFINSLLMLQPYKKNGNIIAGADHDIIYLDVDLVALSRGVDTEFLADLCRSGVHFQDEGFAVFA